MHCLLLFRRAQRWASPYFRVVSVLLLALLLPLQASAQCATENLARSGVASATSTLRGHSPARVNDGNRDTAHNDAYSWVNDYSLPKPLPASVEVALAAPADVDRIYLYFSSDVPIYDYDLQVFNGNKWLSVERVRGNNAAVRVHRLFEPGPFSKVRVVGLEGAADVSSAVFVHEIEVCRAVKQNITTTVQGFVFRYGFNTPIQNVRVDLGGGLVAFTDAAGFYQIANVPTGTYTIRPSRAGWTFGSTQFQNDRLTIQAVGGLPVTNIITGYDRNPIVYVTGWTDTFARFKQVDNTLDAAGYLTVDAQIETSDSYTPPFRTNALNVRTAIDGALYTSGQPQVILFGHSMGGLVSRRYIESDLYRDDVSQLFTFGSPHRGIPNLTALACVANQPAVCDMSKPAMMLFNVAYGQRSGVAYHNVGGDAPMWRQQRICFRIFRRRICIGSITLPDFNFRSGFGWAAGLLIPGPDDGLVQTYSSTGGPGTVDRFLTQEVHNVQPGRFTNLGSRDYYRWDADTLLSQQTYQQCLNPVLVQRSRSNCGFRSYQLPFMPVLGRSAVSSKASGLTTNTEFEQRSFLDRYTKGALQRIDRLVLVDGSPTVFNVKWSAGSARVTLIDPSGQVFDPAFAASIIDGEPLPGEPLSEELDPNMMTYHSDGLTASYHFFAPRPGTWKLVVDPDASMPADSKIETGVHFASDFGMTFANEFPFYLAYNKAELRVTPNAPIFSGSGSAKITRLDGVVDTVALSRQADGSFVGTYLVPNAPGIAEVNWFVNGTNSVGQPFERAGSDSVQISRRTLAVTGVRAEVFVPATAGARSKHAALEVPVSVQSEYLGDAMVTADLVDAGGNVVANATATRKVSVGSNQINLRFSGEELFASRSNGPYRLTNLITLDQRGSDLLSDWLLDQLTTTAYDYRQFGPPVPAACGFKNALLGATTTASSTYPGYSSLRTVDGDRNTALGGDYSWSNNRATRPSLSVLPATLEITLGQPNTIEQILIHSTAAWEIRDYDLEYFDGVSWDIIERVRGNTQAVREHRIPPTSIHALRVVGRSGPDRQTVHVRVNEVEAYGCTNKGIPVLELADIKPVFFSPALAPYFVKATDDQVSRTVVPLKI